MQDVLLSVWTRAGGEPVKMGGLFVSDREARFSYAPEYPDYGLSGLSLVYPPGLFRDSPIVHDRPGSLHPRFRSLIPPADEHNFQRKLMLAFLREKGIEPATPFEADLALLAHTGHGGIGHVDVFADDEAARKWYAIDDSGPLVPVGEQFGFSLKDMISWLDADARFILESLGPTPSVGGAIPKLLVAIPADGWDGRISLPNRSRRDDRLDVVLKIERSQTYPGLAALEAMALDLHRDAGFETPRYWHAEVGGLPALAIERFDRDGEGRPLPLESLFSILAAGARDIERPTDGSLDRIARVIDLADPLLIRDKKAARSHLFGRVLLALLSGNGDLHLENLSLLGAAPEAAFSPVYDPTPMRAWRMHDLLCAVPFGGYGEEEVEGDPLVQACFRFADSLGLHRKDVAGIAAHLLGVAADYPQRVRAVTSLPADNRARLVDIHRDMHRRLQALV
ncbi:MAG TPA: type II toxin-antitoxin system HipA family toxin [Gammaproteobacteria bacterium]|nr:type II toxin-antitoxin system HipA family toxin [Gammaproteobacteria bacterium]